jgi:hypothetical protein
LACADNILGTKIKTERTLKPVYTLYGRELEFVRMRNIKNNLSNTGHGWNMDRRPPKYSKDTVITATVECQFVPCYYAHGLTRLLIIGGLADLQCSQLQ